MIMEKNVRKAVKIVAVGVLGGSLAVIQPISNAPFVHAVIYEDCDLDGYDDATGAVMPWIGFDGTKGDTVPSDWDGKTTYKSYKDYLNSTSKEETNDESDHSASGGSSGSSSGASSETQKSTSSAGSSTTTAKQNSSSQKSESTTNRQGKSSGKSSTSGNSSSSKKKQTSNTNNSSNAGKKKSTAKGSSTAAPEPTAVPAAGKQNKKKTASNPVEEVTAQEETETENIDAAAVDDPASEEAVDPVDRSQVILTSAGQLEVSETDGSVIHAGSDIIIVGSDFASNASGLTIEIHSDHAVPLANVDTAEDGSFEVAAYLPDDLPEGPHEIVLLYQGQEVASRHIEVGAKAANTFLSAITAGFSTDNQGLVPGLLILTGLLVLGIVVTLFGGRTQRQKLSI